VSFRATFVFGPLSGVEHDRMFMAPHVPRRLWFMRSKAERDLGPALPPGGWILTGTDGLAPTAEQLADPDVMYAEYVLDEELSRRAGLTSLLDKPEAWQPGDDEGMAIYKWVFDARWVEQL
jgi:hypothetical protein